MPETMMPSDLQLLLDAQAQLQAAQATINFVSAHLGRVYQITQDDQVDMKTGAIRRSATVAE